MEWAVHCRVVLSRAAGTGPGPFFLPLFTNVVEEEFSEVGY
jgi:hypothetical protein